MHRQLRVGPLDAGFVAAGRGYAAFELVGNHRARDAAEERKRADMARDPVRTLLRARRLCEGVVRRPEHGDEQLHIDTFAGIGVDEVGPLSGVIHKQLLASDMHLPHGETTFPQPTPIKLAELGVAVAGGLALQILLMQEQHRHTRPPTLGVQPCEIWQRPRRSNVRRSVQPPLQCFLRHRRSFLPANAGAFGTANRQTDRAGAHAQASPHLPMGQPEPEFQP